MLSARQQHCLNHMGITLWTRTELKTTDGLQPIGHHIPEIVEKKAELLVPASVETAVSAAEVTHKNYDLDNWDDLIQGIEACTNCELAANCTRKVPGKGNPHADLMIIGEAPGHDEDIQGKPFVGRAGQLLDRMLNAIEITSDDVFICNILKCRPPGNRDPKPHEVDACSQFLNAQVKLIQPRVILSVGRISAQTLLRDSSPLGKLRTTQHTLPNTDIPLNVTYHPAYLLRNPAEKAKVWHDLKSLKKQLLLT